MSINGIGAILTVAGCSCFGFSIVHAHKKQVRILKDLISVLHFMENMLQFNLCPLPDLCRQAGARTTGTVREIFFNMARELDWQVEPDAYSCMYEALLKSQSVSSLSKSYFLQLGISLGQFDLAGQVRELAAVRSSCEQELQQLTNDQEPRLRSCQTLCICSGIALAILLI